MAHSHNTYVESDSKPFRYARPVRAEPARVDPSRTAAFLMNTGGHRNGQGKSRAAGPESNGLPVSHRMTDSLVSQPRKYR
jgi:hypothetical protein